MREFSTSTNSNFVPGESEITMEINLNGSSPETYEDDYIFENPKVRVALIVLYSIVFVFCFFGNLAVVVVMSLHWKMRGPTKFCLGNLAFANLCVGAFCIYQDLSLYLIDNWIFGDFLCKMYHFINSLAHTASILILVVIAAERYFAISQPFRCRRVLTIRRLRVVILLVWILSALLCSPRLYYIETMTNPLPRRRGEPVKYEVICTLLASIYDSKSADMIQFILLFLLPLTVISILYGKVCLMLRHRQTFVCSFVQGTSTSVNSEVLVSGETMLSRVNTKRNNSFHEEKKSPKRKVSFKVAQRGKTISYGLSKGSREERKENVSRKRAKKKEDDISLTNQMESIQRMNLPRRSRPSLRKSISGGGSHVQRSSSSMGTVLQKNPHKGVVRMLVTIVITFALCNFPFHLRKLQQNYFPGRDSDSVWSQLETPLSFLLMYVNCAINPILYAFMSQSFRSCFMDCVRCQIRKPPHSL